MHPCPPPPLPPAGGALPPQLNLSVESWIEWEEAALRPAVYGGSADALAAAVQRVQEGLGGGSKCFLAGAGSQPSLADLVVYATLSPLAGAWSLLLLLPLLPLLPLRRQCMWPAGGCSGLLGAVLLAGGACCAADKIDVEAGAAGRLCCQSGAGPAGGCVDTALCCWR